MVEQLELFTLSSRAVFREEKSRFSAVLESNLFDFGFSYSGRSGADASRELKALRPFTGPFTSRAPIPTYKHSATEGFPPSGNYQLNGMRYHSRSEAACAVLMELFIPGFKIELSKTFQISIGEDDRGNELSVDFLVNGVLVEYHPPHLRSRSYKKEKALRNYIQKQKKRYDKLGKVPGKGAYRRVTEWYYQKRRAQIDQCSAHKGRKLIVASSPEEFYHRVIRRWGKGPVPCRAEFLELFEKLLGKVEALKTRPRNRNRKRFASQNKRSFSKKRRRPQRKRRKKVA